MGFHRKQEVVLQVEEKKHGSYAAWVIGIVIVVIIALVAVTIAFGKFPGLPTQNTTEPITSARLLQAVDMDELSSAEFVFNGIAEAPAAENSNTTEPEYRIAYKATVKAGVKMEDITFDVNNDTKTVTAHLPNINITKAQVDESSLSFLPEGQNRPLSEALLLCENDATQESEANDDLVESAKENLKSAVEALTQPLLESQGYTLEWGDDNAE